MGFFSVLQSMEHIEFVKKSSIVKLIIDSTKIFSHAQLIEVWRRLYAAHLMMDVTFKY